MISSIDQFSLSIVPSDDPNSIYIKLVNLIVEYLGYDYAWIGYVNDLTQEIKAEYAYNNNFDYVKNLVIKIDDANYKKSLTGRAVIAKNYAVINNVETDDTMPDFKEKLLKNNFFSVGAFPLIMYGHVRGVIDVYSAKKGAFDSIKANSIFNLMHYVSYVATYSKSLKRLLTISEMAESILFSITERYEKSRTSFDIDIKEYLNNIENDLGSDFIEVLEYDNDKKEIIEAIFSKGWDYNIGISSVTPAPTVFVQKRILKNRLDSYDYSEDEFATDVYKKMGVRDIILYAFEGTGNKRYLAVTGVIDRRFEFRKQDLEFFKDAINLFVANFEINQLFNRLSSSLELLENRENLVNKLIGFGIVSINLTDKTVTLYNDYFASIFGMEKFSKPINLDELYESVKSASMDKNLIYNIFNIYIRNTYISTIDKVEFVLQNGKTISMQSNIFTTKDNKTIRLIIFEDITDFKINIKKLEDLNKKLNLLNELSYKLSMVFTLEYAIKTFAEGLYSIKKDDGGRVDFLHINIFDTVNKKTVTSLIYSRNENESKEDRTSVNSRNSGRVIVTTNNINYEDYLSNCKLLKNEKNRNKGGTVDNCEFHGAAGSYTCFVLKMSDEVVGTVSVDSEDKNFFSKEILDLIKEIINIASSVFAKLILIETNKELAITDSLTEIYNRRFMYEFAKREIVVAFRNSTDLSIAMLDIDKFKDINDDYGHHIGDILLTEFTGNLKNVLMRKQDIITRYGGDEFVLIFPNTDKENAVNLMEKLRIYIKNKIYNFEGNINLNITVSIGLSSLRSLPDGKNIKNGSDPDDILNRLLKIADDNLYRAKDLGRDRVIG